MTKTRDLVERLCEMKVSALLQLEPQPAPVARLGLRLSREDASTLSDTAMWMCHPDAMVGGKALGMQILTVDADKTEIVQH